MPIPKEPVLFIKAPTCIVGPYDDVVIPRGSEKTDWEVELGVVIGTRASYVAEKDALDHVAGYCVVNDVSERDYQQRPRRRPVDQGQGLPDLRPDRPVAGHRRRDCRSAEAVDVARRQWRADAERLDRDDDFRRRKARLRHLAVHDPRSRATSSPPARRPASAIGKKPPRYLKAGDTVSLGVDGLGQQAQRVVAWSKPA